ncbi:hypothetical protein PIB30_065670 [Stylosanthes scabra]|uniref:Uncharacterized protein n=1 Tax=Stylosanthes scabra TaxID=79078 RepID=A0ABU6XKF8_9FABA|nr:hypothetical protein [Stylosanthes scabra]
MMCRRRGAVVVADGCEWHEVVGFVVSAVVTMWDEVIVRGQVCHRDSSGIRAGRVGERRWKMNISCFLLHDGLSPTHFLAWNSTLRRPKLELRPKQSTRKPKSRRDQAKNQPPGSLKPMPRRGRQSLGVAKHIPSSSLGATPMPRHPLIIQDPRLGARAKV